MTEKSTIRENALRLVAALGLIAILLLGAWGIIQLAFNLPSLFGAIGGGVGSIFKRAPAAETLVVAAPAGVTAGQAFVVSWEHKNGADEHSYGLSYSCASGLTLSAPLPNGSYTDVPCNTQFNYTNAEDRMQLVGKLSDVSQASTTISVSAIKLETGQVAVSGTRALTVGAGVAPKPAPAAPSTPAKPKPAATPSQSYVPSGRTQYLYGYADLAVRITQAPTYVYSGARVTLQFVVENVGTNAAPAGWAFDALLPYRPVDTYSAGPQQRLYPGDRIVYTLGFDTPPYYGYPYSYAQPTVTIQVDPYNTVTELNEQNNYASA